MNRVRRRLLLVVACVLAFADVVLFWHSLEPIYAPITFVGMDSLSVIVPLSQRGATLKDGRWQPAASGAQILAKDQQGNERRLTLVTLTSSAPFGNLIEVIRDLRSQGKCNVIIRGSDEEGPPPSFLKLGDNDLIIPALVVCGQAIGDSGFSGKLPPDGVVRID